MSIVHDVYAALLAGITTKKNDKEIWWKNEYGSMSTIELVDADKEIFIKRHYYINGQKYYEAYFQGQQAHGIKTGWWCDGQIKWQEMFDNGARTGALKTYNANGNMMSSVEYDNGVQHGMAYYYNENGMAYLIEHWNMGQFVNSEHY